MKCEDFQKQYPRMASNPLAAEIVNSTEYSEWCKHLYDCSTCNEWYLLSIVKSRGIDPSNYPCVHLAYHSTFECEKHQDAWECPDATLVQTSNGFGIPVRDGGSSMTAIKYCPWCGVKINT